MYKVVARKCTWLNISILQSLWSPQYYSHASNISAKIFAKTYGLFHIKLRCTMPSISSTFNSPIYDSGTSLPLQARWYVYYIILLKPYDTFLFWDVLIIYEKATNLYTIKNEIVSNSIACPFLTNPGKLKSLFYPSRFAKSNTN